MASMHYLRNGVGFLGFDSSKPASSYIPRPYERYNIGLLQNPRRVREPAPRYDPRQPTHKVYDQIIVNQAKAIFPPTHPPSSYNKNLLESPIKIVEAPMYGRTQKTVDAAFHSFFQVEDSKDDTLHIPAGLTDKIKALTKSGYSQEFVDKFLSNLNFKQMSKLTPQQQSIYAQLVGHHTTPEKDVELTSEELKLVHELSKITRKSLDATLQKVKELIARDGRETALVRLHKFVDDHKAKQSGTPSKTPQQPGTPAAPATPAVDPLEVELRKLGMDPTTEFKDDAYTSAYFQGKSKAEQLEPFKYLFAKGKASGAIPDSKKWNGDSTKFIKNNRDQLITVGSVIKVLRAGNYRMDMIDMKLVPIR